jgi:phage tail protein X
MYNSFNYITQEGDRIDTLAHRFYGGMYGISILSDANPFVPLEAIFEVGTVIIVPIIDNSQVIANENLPPWKRNLQ